MRRPMIAGNWKMNKTPAETVALIQQLKAIQPKSNVEIVVCPMTVSLFAAAAQVKGTELHLVPRTSILRTRVPSPARPTAPA